MEWLLPYLCMVTVPHIMVGLERMLDYRGVGLARSHCTEKSCTKPLYPLPFNHEEQPTQASSPNVVAKM